MWLPKLDILSELLWDCPDVLLMYWCLIYHYIYHDITTIYVMLNIKGIRGSWLYSSLSWFRFLGILYGKIFQFVKFSFSIISFSSLPHAANIFLFKVNNRNTWKTCSICWKLTIKTPKQRQWRHSGVFIVNFEYISHRCLVSLLLTLNK